MNIYAYVGSNPMNYLDITGRAREKIDGHVITVHKSDVDPWPSQPHGHIYDKNLVVDTDGNIYNAANRDNVDQLSKKGKVKWSQFLKRLGPLGVCLVVSDLVTGEAEADEAFADFLMIGSAGPEGTYWPEEDLSVGASPLDCGESCPY